MQMKAFSEQRWNLESLLSCFVLPDMFSAFCFPPIPTNENLICMLNRVGNLHRLLAYEMSGEEERMSCTDNQNNQVKTLIVRDSEVQTLPE